MANKEENYDYPAETPIYRYMSLVRFIQLLEEGFFISSANNFEDAYDCKIPKFDTIRDSDVSRRKENFDNQLAGLTQVKDIKALIEKSITSFRKKIGGATRNSELTAEKIEAFANKLSACDSDKQEVSIELFCILEQETYKSKLISCWCMNPEESYLMWKTYASQGVRIRTSVECFEETIKAHAHAHSFVPLFDDSRFDPIYEGYLRINRCDRVKYLSRDRFDDLLLNKECINVDDYLFFKLSSYKGEEELRFIIGTDNPKNDRELRARYPRGLVVKGLDVASVIQEVRLSPFFSTEEILALTSFFKKRMGDRVRILPSELPII